MRTPYIGLRFTSLEAILGTISGFNQDHSISQTFDPYGVASVRISTLIGPRNRCLTTSVNRDTSLPNGSSKHRALFSCSKIKDSRFAFDTLRLRIVQTRIVFSDPTLWCLLASISPLSLKPHPVYPLTGCLLSGLFLIQTLCFAPATMVLSWILDSRHQPLM